MEEETSLPLPVARQILFSSFYLSQGLPHFQADLFKWVALRRPEWRLTEAMCHQLEALDASVRALMDAGLHKKRRYSSIEPELALQIGVFRWTLEHGTTAGEGDQQLSLLKRIGREMIRRDHFYRLKGRPRSRKARRHAPHPRRDPSFSFVCHYLLEGNKLGVRVFDELLSALHHDFASCGPIFKDIMANEIAQKQFIDVLASYNQAHPDAPVQWAYGREEGEKKIG